MKHILILLSIFMLSALAFAPSAIAADGATIEFEKKTHDFGTIHENGGKVSYAFVFKNVGTKPLVILSARAACGCTRPEYDETPIAPGASSEIKVTFNPSHQLGEIHKNVTVRTNDKKNKKVVLTLNGLVVE